MSKKDYDYGEEMKEMDEKMTIWAPKSREIKPFLFDGSFHAEDADYIEEPIFDAGETKKSNFNIGRRLDLRRFASQNMDIIRNIIIMIVAVVIGCSITYWRTSSVLNARYEVELKAAVFSAEQRLASQMRDEYGVTEAEALQARMEEEARLCAKMLQPMNGNAVNGKRSACWSAFCRVDSPNYDNTLEEVLSQKSAYMGYSEDNQVTQENYDIAYKEVVKWHSGIRPMSYSMVYLLWDPKEIKIFDSMDGNAHYWYESDWDEYDAAHSA